MAKYRSFLEWDIMNQPTSTKIAEKVLSPALGKSIVFYGHKPPRSGSDLTCDAQYDDAAPEPAGVER